MEFIDYAKMYRKMLEGKIAQLEESIKGFPTGCLHIYKNGNRYKWYQDINGERQYITKKEEDKAIVLAKKSFYKRNLVELSAEYESLNQYIIKHDKNKKRSAELFMKEEYSRLLKKALLSEYEKSITEWMEEDYIKNLSHPETLNIRAINGIMVRSKSEAFIAEVLTRAAIPFRYECLLELEGIELYPDFTIMNPVSKDIIIWEHFGLVDNEKYLSNMMSKIRLYINNGYLPFVNFIMTCETNEKPLDFMSVHNIVDNFIKTTV